LSFGRYPSLQRKSGILKGPLVLEFYDYDGKFFTSKRGFGFNLAFGGASAFEWITRDNLDCFRRWRENSLNVDGLMENLSTHICAANVRRMNWEEAGHLMCLSSGGHRRDPPPGEKDFFQFYEEEIAAIPSASQQR
jgi:hypothetical protein